jgi:hypothetical protein
VTERSRFGNLQTLYVPTNHRSEADPEVMARGGLSLVDRFVERGPPAAAWGADLAAFGSERVNDSPICRPAFETGTGAFLQQLLGVWQKRDHIFESSPCAGNASTHTTPRDRLRT